MPSYVHFDVGTILMDSSCSMALEIPNLLKVLEDFQVFWDSGSLDFLGSSFFGSPTKTLQGFPAP